MSLEKKFQDYRSDFFVNPKVPVAPHHIEAAALLMSKLLGKPTDNPDMDTARADPNSELGKFIHLLAEKMQHTRKFDHLSVAQVHPDGNLPAMLAHFASTLRNNNTIIGEVSPVETRMEQEAIAWLVKEIAQYDEHAASGAIVTGGTLANLTGLMVARERLTLEGWDGKTPAYILTTPMAHYSIKKAASILAPKGLIQVLDVPMETNTFKMDVHALDHYVSTTKKLGHRIMAIVGVAGETETGLVDDLQRISEIADANRIYVHIDGAYGAPFIVSKRSHLFVGMNHSNSLVIDPHKYMYTPYPAGAILFRSAQDHSLIEESNKDGAEYMFKTDEGRERAHAFKQASMTHLGRRRLEGSMGGQGAAAVWAVIQTLGVEGLKLVLDHTIDVTDAVYRTVTTSRIFKPAHSPDLNTICFYPTDTRISGILTNPKEQARLVETASAILEQRTGAYLSTTKIEVPTGRGRNNERTDLKVFRFVASHPYTEIEDATEIIDNLHEIWDELVLQEQAKIKRRPLLGN